MHVSKSHSGMQQGSKIRGEGLFSGENVLSMWVRKKGSSYSFIPKNSGKQYGRKDRKMRLGEVFCPYILRGLCLITYKRISRKLLGQNLPKSASAKVQQVHAPVAPMVTHFLSWVINRSVRVTFVLIFAIVQPGSAEYVFYGPLKTLDDSLSLNPNWCHHPLIYPTHLNGLYSTKNIM